MSWNNCHRSYKHHNCRRHRRKCLWCIAPVSRHVTSQRRSTQELTTEHIHLMHQTSFRESTWKRRCNENESRIHLLSMLFHRLRTKCKICRKKSMLCRRFDCQINLNLSVAECEWRFRCQLLIMLDVSKSIWSITLHIAWLKYKAGLHCDKSYATQNLRTRNIRSRRVQYGPGICFLYSAIKCGKSEFLKTKPTILTAKRDEHAQRRSTYQCNH